MSSSANYPNQFYSYRFYLPNSAQKSASKRGFLLELKFLSYTAHPPLVSFSLLPQSLCTQLELVNLAVQRMLPRANDQLPWCSLLATAALRPTISSRRKTATIVGKKATENLLTLVHILLLTLAQPYKIVDPKSGCVCLHKTLNMSNALRAQYSIHKDFYFMYHGMAFIRLWYIRLDMCRWVSNEIKSSTYFLSDNGSGEEGHHNPSSNFNASTSPPFAPPATTTDPLLSAIHTFSLAQSD